MRRVRLLNGQFDAITLTQAVDSVFELLARGQRGWLCTVNVAVLMMMRSDPRLQSFVDRAAVVVADGQPLVWCAPWFNQLLPERVTGIDLIDALCARAVREQKSVYFLGATDGTVKEVASRFQERFPGLQIAFASGYFGKHEACMRADRVRASGADILFVGMGVPRQEYFIEEQWERLGVGIAVGIGGSFDVLAGLRWRAPSWVQAVGLEWLYRLIQEPRRLAGRYLVTNCQFIWLVLRALITNRTDADLAARRDRQ